MSSKEYFLFKNRFKKIEEIDRKENGKASIKDKLKQLVSIVKLGGDLGMFPKKKDKTTISNNWKLLKTSI